MYMKDLIAGLRELPPEDWELPMGTLAERYSVPVRDITEAIDYIKANPQPINMRGSLSLRRMGVGNNG
jgi:hypothetical protein